MLKLLKAKIRKKKISLTGRLLYPPEVGMPAMIQEFDGLRRTSSVCRVSAGKAQSLVIETQNTIYVLGKGEAYETKS